MVEGWSGSGPQNSDSDIVETRLGYRLDREVNRDLTSEVYDLDLEYAIHSP